MKESGVAFGHGGGPPVDGRLDAPAFHRNHGAIWSVIAPFLHGRTGDVLEAGSGTGQHVIAFARHAPRIVWWPSDIDVEHLQSIEAWRVHARLPNVRPPLRIDLSRSEWGLGKGEHSPPDKLLAIFCTNVLHIAPWRVAEGLLQGAARHLRTDGRMFIYGPFMRNGEHTAPSNAAFDASLRRNDPEWGVRDVDDLAALAEAVGLKMMEVVDMPANNFILIFEHRR